MASGSTTPGPAAASDSAARLRDLERRLSRRARELEAQRDSRCVFTHAYSLMTRRIAEEAPGSGVDEEWITDLAEAFAAHYFAALDADEASLSPAWRRAFEAMRDKRTSVLEDLVFAMAVHIMHDLPLALGDLSPPEGPEPKHIFDFHAVNDMMASSIDLIQRATTHRYAPYIGWLDQLGERFDELLTDYGIRMSRGLAWYNAIRLADPRSAAKTRESIERSPTIVIDDIVNPSAASLRILFRLLRWIVSFLRVWPHPSVQRGMDLPEPPRSAVEPEKKASP
ncbi:MAG TPA: DUF5995 family protein [Solirubrobacterales bacterium]|nr:DUF5995 family protein [Solirubrobacterales bacterium]